MSIALSIGPGVIVALFLAALLTGALKGFTIRKTLDILWYREKSQFWDNKS